MIPRGGAESLSFNQEDFDWYVLFRPVSVLELGFSTDFFLAGSYLVIEDDNISGGKIGSDGFTLAFTGVHGLTIAATVPFGFDNASQQNWFADSRTSPSRNFNFGLGAEYAFSEVAAVGVTAHDLLNADTRGFGVYGMWSGLEGFALYAGYAYNDQEGLCGVSGDHVVNASALYEISSFSLAADYVTTIDSLFYAGLQAGYNITEAFNISLAGLFTADYTDAANGEVTVNPSFTFTNETAGEFCVEANVILAGGSFDSVNFPLSWKYLF